MRFILGIIFILFSSTALAMFCPIIPDNFKIINQGDTLEKVLDTCGQPINQKSYIKKIGSNISTPVGGGVTTANINQYGNSISYTSSTTQPTYVKQSYEEEIEITELYYQTAVLIFSNGILVDRRIKRQ